MIRILVILLAVVAVVLAFLLQQPLLYGAAGLLLVIAGFLVAAELRRRNRREKRTSEPSPRKEVSVDDDLGALGILEIRPKEKPGARKPVAEPAEASTEDAVAGTAEAMLEDRPKDPVQPSNGRHSSGASRLMIKEITHNVHVAVDAEATELRKEVVVPYLQAMLAAIEAHTVCLLKQEELGFHYHIEAIVSQNAYARSGGSFASRTPLFSRDDTRFPVVVRPVGEHGLPATCLGYYREILAIRQVAVAPVPFERDGNTFFIIVDSMQEGGLQSSRQRDLITQFAHLLGSLLSDEAREEDAERLRPRREIVAEEMKQARRDKKPLALALVYLNRAETLSGSETAPVEEVLEARLREAAAPHRVERFGELTYGVFYNGPVADVEAWAVRLQSEVPSAGGMLEGGVSIGIALLQDRHLDPDAFRGDATDALREAYETGTCTILE